MEAPFLLFRRGCCLLTLEFEFEFFKTGIQFSHLAYAVFVTYSFFYSK